MTPEDIRMLENNKYNHDIILNGKGSLSTYNVTVRSINETQPSKVRPKEYVYGRDGYIDMSQKYGAEHFTDREFTVVFNIYENCGNRREQRNRLVNWLRSGEGMDMTISTRKNAVYKNCRIDIGNFERDREPKGKYQSTLTVKITTNPKYLQDGAYVI